MENFETFRLDQTGQQTQAILDQVSTNTADIAQLYALYEALTQNEPVIIQPTDTWPVADPQENVIYRVIDRVNTPPQSYSDYMWNGTAMALMATYNNSIDNEPTPGSNNLVKSGGVAASIVFDISAYHATGSTLATYSNLAAALGTNGENVPASVRKGGMSVKFVNSSDNKYVQYRLMATSFSTIESDWQKVESLLSCIGERLSKGFNGYTSLESVSSPSNGYVNIGLNCGEYKFALDVKANDSNNGSFFGAIGTADARYYLMSNNGCYSFGWDGGSSDAYIETSRSIGNSRHKIEVSMISGNIGLNVDGETIHSSSATPSYPINAIYLFQGKAFEIFGVTIYDKNDVIIRNLIPCKRNSDNKYGLFDIVNYRFYESLENAFTSSNIEIEAPFKLSSAASNIFFESGSVHSVQDLLDYNNGIEEQVDYTELTIIDDRWYWADVNKLAKDRDGDGYLIPVGKFRKVHIGQSPSGDYNIAFLTQNIDITREYDSTNSTPKLPLSNAGYISASNYAECVTLDDTTKYMWVGKNNGATDFLPEYIIFSNKDEDTTITFNESQDGTSLIQNALNKGGDIHLKGNATITISQALVISKSHTHLYVGENITLKLADGVGGQIIKTESFDYRSDSPLVDTQRIEDVVISGGIWDFNRANQQSPTSATIHSTVPIGIMDVDRFELSNLTIYNPRAFGAMFGGLHQFHIYNIWLHYPYNGANMDGLHFAGNCQYGLIENIWGNTHDDMIALNFDGDTSQPENNASIMYRRGDCYDIVVKNIFGDNAMRAVRILNGTEYKADNIVIDGIYGKFYCYGVVNIGCWMGVSQANFGKITINNVHAYDKHTYDADNNSENAIINIGDYYIPKWCNIEQLKLSNIEMHQNSTYQSTMLNLSISNIKINNLFIIDCSMLTDDVDLSDYKFISGGGQIGNLMLSNILVESPSSEPMLSAICNPTPANILCINAIINAISKYSASGVLNETGVIYNGNLQI